ncbi:DUF6701 domain-containing protein [Colwelliaceae bacterium MEBiC 14330]
MQYRLLVALFVFLCSSQLVYAVECSAVFPDGLQNNDSQGTITFGNNSQLLNSADNILASNNSIISNGGNLTCGTINCSDSGSAAPAVSYTIPGGGSGDAILGTSTTLAPGNYNNYQVNYGVSLTLSAGDYIFNNLTLISTSKIIIAGADDLVRIFVKDQALIGNNTQINVGGDPSNLLLYFSTDTTFVSDNTLNHSNTNAFIYSDASIQLNSGAQLTGAINAKNITLISASSVIFDDTQPEFGDFCGDSLLAYYQFDEPAWTGAANEVIDQTGNYNAQAINGTSTDNLAPAISGTEGTCGYGTFDGTNDYITLPNSFDNLQESFTITAWINPANVNAGSRIFADDENNTGGFSFSLGDGGNGRLRFYSRAVTPVSVDTDSSVPSNEWVFVAAVHNSVTKTRQIYINGVVQELLQGGTSNTYTGDWGTDSGPSSIGGETDSGETNNRFTGNIDELRVYKEALDASKINALMAETHTCSATATIELKAGRVTLKDTAGIDSSGFDSNSNELPPGFTEVCFDTPFSEPPAVFTMPTRQNNQFTNRLTLRIRNVTETGFQVTQVRSEGANDPNGYAPQTVDFIAVKKGNYQLASNQQLTVGAEDVTQYQTRRRTGASWRDVPLDLPNVPAVLATMQTMNNEFSEGPFPFSQPFMAATIQNVEDDNFQLAIEQGETNTSFSQAETIAYLAITPGAGVLIPASGADPGVTYEAIRTEENIGGLTANYCRNANFTSSFADTPLVVASQNTRRGGDGGWLERCSISSTSVGFNVTEDGRDNDDFHLDEIAGVLALGGNFADYTNSCAPAIHHFEIDTGNAEGLTCEEDTITIKACANADCTTLSNDAVDVDLIVKDGTTTEFTKTVTIVGGQANINYRYTKAGNAGITLAPVDPQITNNVECADNANLSTCLVNFKETGFRFINGIVNGIVNQTLPIQLSGKPSNVGFNATTNLAIEAVTTDGSATPSCQALLVTGESIEMGAKYQSPAVEPSSAKTIDISGTTIEPVTDNNYNYTEVPLDFGDDSQNSANYVFTYDNAGSVLLNARYELPDEEGNPSGNYITGTSNPIIVRPFAFDVQVAANNGTANPAAQNASGNVFIAAGSPITVTTRAVAWASGNDSNANGLADENENLSGNSTTTNFIASNASLVPSLVAPSGSSGGSLGNLSATFSGNFTAGENSFETSYSEVGIIALTVNVDDYLAAGINITGEVPFVGRFTPAYFQVTSIVNGALKATCSTNETLDLPFVYSGQKLLDNSNIGALSYASTPTITIEARNQDGALTQNYINDFFKLTQASFERLTISPTLTTLAPDTDATQQGKNGDLVRLTANLNAGEINNTAGVITYSYNSNDNFSYLHEENSEINPFTADIDLSMVAIIDGDDIATVDFDGDALNGLIVTLNPEGTLIRFGRAQLENSYGPETSNLAQTLSVNYFLDDQYIVSETDQCTPYNSTEMSVTDIDLINFSQIPPKNPAITNASGKFIDETPSGITRAIELTATGAGNTGSVCVSYNIVPWLKYRWATDEDNLQCPFNADDVDDSFDDNPFGIATFGLYRGNDRIIYQREIE